MTDENHKEENENPPADNPVEEAVDSVPVVDEATEEVEFHTEERPAWVDEILEAVHGVTAPVTDTADHVEEETPNPENPEMPKDGDVVPDETPVKKPWTHRGFGR